MEEKAKIEETKKYKYNPREFFERCKANQN